jgi:hypothetical protein
MKYYIIIALLLIAIAGGIAVIVLGKRRHRYTDKASIALSVFAIDAAILVIVLQYSIKA